MGDKMTADVSAMRETMRNCATIRNRELIHAYKVLDADEPTVNGYASAYIDARLYMGRSRNAEYIYAIVWINGRDTYGHGIGSAGGYGYDKSSAAVGEAIDDAGIKLSARINGVGETAIREALLAVASALGASRPFIVEVCA